MGKLAELVLRELDIFRRKFYESSFLHLPILKVEVFFVHSCLTLCNPVTYSVPGSSVHGVLQASILEWVAIPFSRGSSRPRN